MLSGRGQDTQFLKSNPFLTEWVCKRMRVTRISSVLGRGEGQDSVPLNHSGFYTPGICHPWWTDSMLIHPSGASAVFPTHTFLPLPFASPGEACGGEVGGPYIDQEPL